MATSTMPLRTRLHVEPPVAVARWLMAIAVWLAAIAANVASAIAHFEHRNLPTYCMQSHVQVWPFALALVLTGAGIGASWLQLRRNEHRTAHVVMVVLMLIALFVQLALSLRFAMDRPDLSCFD
jgi:cation transport ATPase